ncbi:MAG TPA: hypothetical protein PLB18_07615 [Acidobacteriota bacterium]|nr:hypothetical protein [Acidobacteriota bacterium]
MVTLVNIIQFAIKQQAVRIHEIKFANLVEEEVTILAYVSPPDEKTFRIKLPKDPGQAGLWMRKQVTYIRKTGHLTPKNPRWAEYQIAKRWVSVLLTARHLLKIGNGDVLERDAFFQAVRSGQLCHHVRKTQHPRQMAIKAHRLLRKLKNRLEHTPERFAEVEAWMQRIAEEGHRGA